MYVFEQRQIWSRLFYSGQFPAALADFVGISQVATNLFLWQLRPSARPHVTAGARPIFLDGAPILERLAKPDFDPREIVYLPIEAKSHTTITNISSPRVTQSAYRAGSITADIDAPEPALLVVAETFYPGWQGHVNGHRVKIWKANHAFQALEVPAGRSHVSLVYKDKQFFYGSLLSCSTLLGCLIGWFRARPAISP
jgi:hypothetical protein